MAWHKHSKHPAVRSLSNRNSGHTPKWAGSGWWECKCPACATLFKCDPTRKPKCRKCEWGHAIKRA